MKAIVYDIWEWEQQVWPKIVEDHGPAVNISWVCKQRLGFTVRRHTDYNNVDKYDSSATTVRLDFYDEVLLTMFLLKYQ